MFKTFVQKFFLVIAITTSLCSTGFAANDYYFEDQPLVIEEVVQIEQKGTLKQKANGYLYLDVSDDFITLAIPLIDVPGRIVPPSHYTNKKGIGAHISVIYENEIIAKDIWEIEELGQEYTFSVMELRSIKMTNNNKMQKLWLIAVDAPELETLRKKYGLRPLLKGHDFHITIGTQLPNYYHRAKIVPLNSVQEEELQEAA
jgi:hypothetical protein